MRQLAEHYQVQVICRVWETPRRSYYYQPRAREQHELRTALQRLAGEWPRYGSRRLTGQLQREGFQVNRKHVQRLMRELGVQGHQSAKKRRTTNSEHSFPRYRNLVEQLEVVRPEQEVGGISHSLKALARELDIPVLALAQVSRAFEGRLSKKLQLSDLRDGSLENDADLVLFLSVSEAEIPAITNNPRLATISIAKHRHGPRADLDICYLPASSHFCDLQTLAPSPTPEQPADAPTSASQSAKNLPRLQEIMARVTQGGRTPIETGSPPTITTAQSGRSLPIGSVLEDEEV